MQRYAEAAVETYENALDDSVLVETLKADIKVKDTTIRTLQTDLLRLKNKFETTTCSSELITLRRKVAELEERCTRYSWATDKTQWGA
jgi:hypothetical protein